jgi:uncharacterized protein YeaC (DUF1315 family)
MGKHIVNNHVIVGDGPEAHFATLEEFDTWFEGFRKRHRRHNPHVTLSVKMNRTLSNVLMWVAKRNLVQENLSVKITRNQVFESQPPPQFSTVSSSDSISRVRDMQVNKMAVLIHRLYNPLIAK